MAVFEENSKKKINLPIFLNFYHILLIIVNSKIELPLKVLQYETSLSPFQCHITIFYLLTPIFKILKENRKKKWKS